MTEKMKAEKSIKDTSIELSDFKLDEMDFEIVKKIIADSILETSADDILIDEDIQKDEHFVEIIVRSLEEGLKKASHLLEVPVKELKYSILDKEFEEIDGERVQLQKIKFQKKLVTGEPKIKVSEDRLSAYFSVIFPKISEDMEVDDSYLMDLIEKEKIYWGIQRNVVRNSVKEVLSNYDALFNVVFAKGDPPIAGKACELEYSVFSDISNIQYIDTFQKYLNELLNSGSIDTIKKQYFPVEVVYKGELIASTTEPGEGKNGKDVFGKDIIAEKGSLLFKAGKNVTIRFENNHVNYYADIFGYLEFDEGTLNVYSPIWISEDCMKAYFIGLPSIDGTVKKCDSTEIYDLLKMNGIKYGIKENEIEFLVNLRKSDRNIFMMKLIAEGVEAHKGDDAKIELFFSEGVRPGKLLEDGRIDYREIDNIKTVKNNQLIAVKYPPKKGTAGKNLKGDVIPAITGDDKKLFALNNVRTVKGIEKTLFYATIEGRVILVGDSGISVNQVYELKGNVDFSTGNIDFNGDVQINGSVVSGFKVKAGGNISIKGTVNQDSELISGANISVKQGILGREFNTRIKAKGNVIAQFIQNSIVESGADVVIKDYVMNSIIKAKGRIISPDVDKSMIGTGSLVGGELIATKGIIANSIGSDFAKMTKVIVGVDFNYEETLKNLNKSLDYCDKELSRLSKFLRLGFQDINTLKKRIAKLPKDKQMPFIQAFKKLSEITQLRSDIMNRRDRYFLETEALSSKASIIIKKELYQRVNMQIGEIKMISDKLMQGPVKLIMSKNKKNIVIGK